MKTTKLSAGEQVSVTAEDGEIKAKVVGPSFRGRSYVTVRSDVDGEVFEARRDEVSKAR